MEYQIYFVLPVFSLPGSLRNMYPNLWAAVERGVSVMDVGQMLNRITQITSIIKTQLRPLMRKLAYNIQGVYGLSLNKQCLS